MIGSPTGRVQAAVLARRDDLLEQDRGVSGAVAVEVLERPLEAGGDGPDVDVGRDRGVDDVERLPREHEQDRDDDRRDQRPHDLDEVVAVGLGRQLVVAGLAPEAERRVDDQALDQEEDHERDVEHEVVQRLACSASGRSPAPGCATGRSCSTAAGRDARGASRTSTNDDDGDQISRPAMSGPDPVRDRGGIDIGFLERRRPAARVANGPANEVSPSADGRRPCRGAGTLLIIPDGRGVGSRRGMARGRVGAEARECPGETPPSDPVPRAPARRSRARRGCSLRRRRRARAGPGRARPWHGGPAAARPRDLRLRLVVRPAGLAAGDRRPAAVAAWASSRVNRAHPEPSRSPRRRTVYWVVGVFAVLYAIDSGPRRSTTRRCSRCTWSSTCC